MRPIETLPLPSAVISGLIKFGYRMCDDIFDENGDMDTKVVEILRHFSFCPKTVMTMVSPPPVYSAAQLFRVEAMEEAIPTFSEALDNILGGGVVLSNVLQVCGPPGSGKSQFLLQLCVDVQIPEVLGGLESEAVFIDTELCFTVSRLREIAAGALRHCEKLSKMHNLDNLDHFSVDSILRGVHYISINNYEQLLATVHHLTSFLETHPKVKLIVIDSFVFPFITMTNILDRTRWACTTITKLHELAKMHSVAVVLTNNLTTRIIGNSKMLCPALGESVTHRIHETLLLGKIGSNHSAVMYKSICLPESVVTFSISKDGVRDVKSSN